MWSTLNDIAAFLVGILGNIMNLYTTIDIFIAVFIIWLARRILKAFNLIS